MSRRLTRIWPLLPMLFLAGQASALGLGDIRLSSALNEPLRAEIELLAATPEELDNLTVKMASAETFERYGLDRPLFLQQIEFDISKTGSANGNVVRIRSATPVTEPFVTFLVEAVWSRGRLLREYTILLDPPTFAPPPATDSTQSVTAPNRSTQSDAGRIERPTSSQQTQPATQTAPSRPPVAAPVQSRASEPVASSDPAPERSVAEPKPTPEPPAPRSDEPYDTGPDGSLQVSRGDTLWSIARQVRPDNRLSMNQTMMAIYEANPAAFAGNINVLSAGSVLRIPNADDVFRISRGEALNEVQRQHAEWGGATYTPPTQTAPSLTLVPPDEDALDYEEPVSSDSGYSYSRETEIEDRIAELEADVPDQDALLQIRNNELAQLRSELARLRGEPEPLPLEDDSIDDEYADEFGDDEALDDEMVEDDEQIFVDDEIADDEADIAGDVEDAETDEATTPVVTAPPPKPSLVDTILGYVMSWWGAIAGAVILVIGILIWFARRAGRDDDDDSTGVWDTLDADEMDGSMASTARLSALAQEDESSMVVVEQESKAAMAAEMTQLRPTATPAAEIPPAPVGGSTDPLEDTGTNKSLEDTFSSETAINLDQSDPIAEADFHMAYGLHDQAADLINGALEVEPEREDLLSKLCEVYFVWGNRDAFVDAAHKMTAVVGDRSSAEWDKIVIMGQQIAADHVLFSGKSAGEATKAVDLSFDVADDGPGELDIDFNSGPDGAVSDVIDLGAASGEVAAVGGDSMLDFNLDDDDSDTSASVTQQMPAEIGEASDADLSDDLESLDDIFGDDNATFEAGFDDDEAAETQALSSDMTSDDTAESPTIEQQFATLEASGVMPGITVDAGASGSNEAPIADDEATKLASLDDDDDLPAADQTAEIDLDDLGLDLDSLEDTSLAGDLDDLDVGEELSDLDATGEAETLNIDDLEATGRNLSIGDELAATGRNPAVEELDSSEATGVHTGLDIEDALAATSEMPGLDEETSVLSDTTGVNPAIMDDMPEDDPGATTSLLDATGQTQVLSDDLAVETFSDIEAKIGKDDATLLASGYGDDDTIEGLSSDAETLLAPLDDDDDEGDFDFAKTEALPKDVFTGDTNTDETGELPSLAGSTDMDLDLDDLTAALKVSEVGDTVNQLRDDATVEHPGIRPDENLDLDVGFDMSDEDEGTAALSPEEVSEGLHDARTMTEVGTKLDLARAYVDMGDPSGARAILEEVLDEGDDSQRQQAQQLLDSLPS